MELFGKEIKLDTNVSPKQAKLSLLILSIVVVVVLSAIFIVKPALKIKDLNVEIENRERDLTNKKTQFDNAVKEYNRRYAIFKEQSESYNREKERFENSSLQDDTSLKYMVADIAEHLNIKILEVGGIEVEEENEEYLKKYIPYKVIGDINSLGQFFYFLENSNYLVTFKGSDLDIQISNVGEVSVRMNIGGYFNRGAR